MKHKLDYQTVLLQGHLVGEVVSNEGGEIENVSFMVRTQEVILGNTITQIHNVTAIKENAALIKSCAKGVLLRISARLLWLGEEELWVDDATSDDDDCIEDSNDDSDIPPITSEHEVVTYKYLDLLASKIVVTEDSNAITYSEVLIQGVLSKDAEYSASMEGTKTKIVIRTEDNFFGELVTHSNSLMALNKYALAYKDLKKSQLVEAKAKLLWLDGKSDVQEYEPERACELIPEVIIPLQTKAKDTHNQDVEKIIMSFICSENQDELDSKVDQVLLSSSIEKSIKGITTRINIEVNQNES